MASCCAYLRSIFTPHQRAIDKLFGWTQNINFSPVLERIDWNRNFLHATPESVKWSFRQHYFRRVDNGTECYNICKFDTCLNRHPFFAHHSSVWQDLACLSNSDAKSYGYSMKFTTLKQAMYDKAFSSVQIKVNVAGPFLLQCSITQGCPMSTLLLAVVLNLLICLLERHLMDITSIRIGHRKK
jgi:hypothetical protein